MGVKELHDMESAAVHIEVYVSLLEVRCNCLPQSNFRVKFFDRTPGFVSDAFTVHLWRYEQKVQVSPVSINMDHDTTCRLSVTRDAVRLTAIDRLLDRLT